MCLIVSYTKHCSTEAGVIRTTDKSNKAAMQRACLPPPITHHYGPRTTAAEVQYEYRHILWYHIMCTGTSFASSVNQVRCWAILFSSCATPTGTSRIGTRLRVQLFFILNPMVINEKKGIMHTYDCCVLSAGS